jgi:hypothetical protein
MEITKYTLNLRCFTYDRDHFEIRDVQLTFKSLPELKNFHDAMMKLPKDIMGFYGEYISMEDFNLFYQNTHDGCSFWIDTGGIFRKNIYASRVEIVDMSLEKQNG